VAFFALVIAANMTPAHGFSILELLIPLIVFWIFSVVPMSLALKEWRLKPHRQT
jgi:Sec-independent protein secretion pathway component TatC